VDILHNADVTGIVHVDNPYEELMVVVVGLYLKDNFIGKGCINLCYVGGGEMRFIDVCDGPWWVFFKLVRWLIAYS
jgi:hypothetical protein